MRNFFFYVSTEKLNPSLHLHVGILKIAAVDFVVFMDKLFHKFIFQKLVGINT